MTEPKPCVICEKDAIFVGEYDYETGSIHIRCNRCGEFKIKKTVIDDRLIRKQDAHKVSAFVRARGGSTPIPLLTTELIDEIQLSPEKTLEEKSRLLLEVIESKSPWFGTRVILNVGDDYPLVSARNGEELHALCNFQKESGNIQYDGARQGMVELKAKGINELAASRRTSARSEKVFVAMWFDGTLKPAYIDHIEPGLRSAGYRAIRMDLEEHNDDVIARVLTEIREARFVVAEFTGHRNGVYFEAGFAKGLGLEVVWLCRADHMKDAHFDTSHFNHLTWKDGDDLKTKLSTRILATIGPGPLKTVTT